MAFAVIGIGWAAINVNSYPMIVEMSKGSDIGKFTGTYYTFSMAAQILTPILSGFLLENVSYRTLFPYAFVFSVLAFITMTQVRHGDARPDKKKSLLENFDVDDSDGVWDESLKTGKEKSNYSKITGQHKKNDSNIRDTDCGSRAGAAVFPDDHAKAHKAAGLEAIPEGLVCTQRTA